jgi:hypothetical protein
VIAWFLLYNTTLLLRFNTSLFFCFDIVLLLRLATLICLQLLGSLICLSQFYFVTVIYFGLAPFALLSFFFFFHESSPFFFFFLVHFSGVHPVFLFIVVLRLFGHNGCFCRLFEDSQESVHHHTESRERTHRGP